jgi:hypothetical protein
VKWQKCNGISDLKVRRCKGCPYHWYNIFRKYEAEIKGLMNKYTIHTSSLGLKSTDLPFQKAVNKFRLTFWPWKQYEDGGQGFQGHQNKMQQHNG